MRNCRYQDDDSGQPHDEFGERHLADDQSHTERGFRDKNTSLKIVIRCINSTLSSIWTMVAWFQPCPYHLMPSIKTAIPSIKITLRALRNHPSEFLSYLIMDNSGDFFSPEALRLLEESGVDLEMTWRRSSSLINFHSMTSKVLSFRIMTPEQSIGKTNVSNVNLEVQVALLDRLGHTNVNVQDSTLKLVRRSQPLGREGHV